jgi:hypothetical protein
MKLRWGGNFLKMDYVVEWRSGTAIFRADVSFFFRGELRTKRKRLKIISLSRVREGEEGEVGRERGKRQEVKGLIVILDLTPPD